MIAERVQLLGGISLAMAPDVAETAIVPRPPKGREEAPVQISRFLHAHEIVLEEAHSMARQAAESGDDGTNDRLVSDVIRTNEKQAWFVAEHLVDVPLVKADRAIDGGIEHRQEKKGRFERPFSRFGVRGAGQREVTVTSLDTPTCPFVS
jgi:hypothetical protein